RHPPGRSSRLALVHAPPRAGQYHHHSAAAEVPRAQPGRERLAVHARQLAKAGTVCVGVNLISADGTPGVSVAVSVRAYMVVAESYNVNVESFAKSTNIFKAD